VTLSASDTHSGVSRIVYTLDNGAPVEVDSGVATVTVTTEGSHTLSWHALDTAGNPEEERTLNFKNDKTPPTLDVGPNIQVIETEPIAITPTVADNLDPAPLLSNNAPAVFPLGTTLVTITATDHAGLTATGSLSVTVISVEQALERLVQMIENLADDLFEKNAAKQKKALVHKIEALLKSLMAAKHKEHHSEKRKNYFEHTDSKLTNDVREKMDGCFGGRAKDDWILCAGQKELLAYIDRILAVLTRLKADCSDDDEH